MEYEDSVASNLYLQSSQTYPMFHGANPPNNLYNSSKPKPPKKQLSSQSKPTVVPQQLDFDSSLIDHVREWRALYDVKLHDHHSRTYRERAWRAIARAMNCEGKCQLNCTSIYILLSFV